MAYSDLLKSISGDEELLNDLAEHIKTTLKEGSIPLNWLDGNLSVLLKPNKDYRTLKGYRVITMANTLVKLCEKIATKRVTEELEKEVSLPKEVGGARPKRSTTSSSEALIFTMQKGLQDKEHFASGLYRVRVPTLANKMITYGISEVMVRWILSMLDIRRCKMRFGSGSLSALKLALAWHKVPL